MKERPIIMSLDHPLKILRGQKTLTQRVVKRGAQEHLLREGLTTCPYGYPGDRLWVRETWMDLRGTGIEPYTAAPTHYAYAADTPAGSYGDECRKDLGLKWRSPIHMPRDASRLTLELTDVKVRRVQDMTEKDAVAEGFSPITRDCKVPQYAKLWDKINGRTYPWASNPWVWALYFKVV